MLSQRAVPFLLGGLVAFHGVTALAQGPRFEETPHEALRGLRSMDAATRRASASALLRFKNDEAVRNALGATLLQDPDPGVRQTAAVTLAKLGGKSKKALIQAAVCDPDAQTRSGLAAYGKRVKLLCHTQPDVIDEAVALPRAEEQLLAYLSHPSPTTRLAAARDLAKLRSARAYGVIWNMVGKDPVWSVRVSSLRILTRAYGKKALPVLQRTLAADPDARVREVALEGLGFVRDPASVPAIATSARVEQLPSVQLAAVAALAKIGDRTSTAALMELFDSSKSEEARAAVVTTLAGLPAYRKYVQPLLARALKQDRSGKVRAAAMKALSNDTSAAACSARSERINDPDADVRRAVVEQLAKCPGQIARPALMIVLREDKDAGVRKTALELLIKGGAAKAAEAISAALLGDKDVAIRKRCLEAVLTLPQAARGTPLAEAAKNDPDVLIRRSAVAALFRIPSAVTVPALAVVVSRDKVVQVRVEAARVLSRFRDAGAYEALQKAMKDPAAEVRQVAAAGAAASPAQRAWVEALLPQIIDPSPATRLKAATQLCAAQAPHTYRALLLALWTDENASIRTAIAKCFGDLDHPLIDLGLSVAHSTDTDGGLIRTVEMSQRQRVERQAKLLEKAKSKDAKERAQAIRALQPSPSKQVRDLLEALLQKDPDAQVRKEAAGVVALYRDRRALQRLMQDSQTESDSSVRQFIALQYNTLRTRWSSARSALNINSLIVGLRGGTLESRVASAQALGALRDRRAFAPLKEATSASEPQLRQAAVIALATFGDLTVVPQAARTEQDKPTRDQLIQLNYLRSAAVDKITAALASGKPDEVRRGIEAASIKQINQAVPWLVRLALSHGDAGIREAAVRTLVLYDLPLAKWSVRIAAEHDASKKTREAMWQWSVLSDSDNS